MTIYYLQASAYSNNNRYDGDVVPLIPLSTTDNIAANVQIICNAESGSYFPIDFTIIGCESGDDFENLKYIDFITEISDINSTPEGDTTDEGSLPPEGDTTDEGSLPPEGDTTDEGSLPPEGNLECTELNIRDITASGFETDPSDYHPPLDAIDKDSSTWWSNKDENSWVKIDLGDKTSLCNVTVEWNKGDQRKYTFEISTSQDGNEFKKIFEGSNQRGSTSAELYNLDNAEGRYLMLTVTGSSSNQGWVSIREIGVLGEKL